MRSWWEFKPSTHGMRKRITFQWMWIRLWCVSPVKEKIITGKGERTPRDDVWLITGDQFPFRICWRYTASTIRCRSLLFHRKSIEIGKQGVELYDSWNGWPVHDDYHSLQVYWPPTEAGIWSSHPSFRTLTFLTQRTDLWDCEVWTHTMSQLALDLENLPKFTSTAN